MIRCRTVSNKDPGKVDEAEFERFRKLVLNSYPTVVEKAVPEIISGGMLFRIKGRSSEAPAVFMSHFDVVEAGGEGWEVSPFEGVVKDGFVWGRGAIDTKCTLLSIMEAAEALLKDGFVPQNDIYFAFGCNEEIAGPCAEMIAKTLEERGVKPAFVLDEGGMIYHVAHKLFPYDLAAVGIAEKGPMDVLFTVRGESGHASRPPQHTAVGRLAADIARIEKRQFPMKIVKANDEMAKALAPFLPKITRPVLRHLSAFGPLVFAIAKKNNTAAAFFRTTIAFTQLKGSDGANVLPEEASAVANVRLSQGVKSDEAVAYMLKSAKDRCLSAEIINKSEATSTSPFDGKYKDIIEKAVKAIFPGTIVAPYLMIGGTDSRFYDGFCPCIYKFAPVLTEGGLLKTVHSDNERISVDNLGKMIEFFTTVIGSL